MKKRLVRIMAALMSFVLIAGTDVSAGVEKSSYEGAYDEVLSVISDAVKAGSDYDSASEYVSNGLIEKLMYPGDSVLEEDIGYAIEDISGDGVPELIVGCDDDYTDNGKQSYIYSIFSLKNGKPVTVMEGWVRSSYRWLGDGQFFYLGSGGASTTLIGENHLSKDGLEIVWDDFYFTEGDLSGELTYYHNTSGIFDANKAEKINISDKQFSRLVDSYEKKCELISWTPIGKFGSSKGAGKAEKNKKLSTDYASTGDTIRISKDNQRKFNLFLSNFAEQRMEFYDSDQADLYRIGYFAYLWSYINKNSDVKVEDYYYKIGFDSVKKLADRYFGLNITEADLEDYGEPDEIYQGFYKKGNYYIPAADGDIFTQFAVVKSAELTEADYLRLEFSVFDLGLEEYRDNGDSIPKDYYSLTKKEAESRPELTETGTGFAILKKSGDSYKLLYYELYGGDEVPYADVSYEGNIITINGNEMNISDCVPLCDTVMGYSQAGSWVIVEGHINPHRSIYEFYNLYSEDFEYEISGTNLIWWEDDPATAVYADIDTVYDIYGNLIGWVDGEISSLEMEDVRTITVTYVPSSEKNGKTKTEEIIHENYDHAVFDYYSAVVSDNESEWEKFYCQAPEDAYVFVIQNPTLRFIDNEKFCRKISGESRRWSVGQDAYESIAVVALRDGEKVHIESDELGENGSLMYRSDDFKMDRGEAALFELYAISDALPQDNLVVRTDDGDEFIWPVLTFNCEHVQMSEFF